MPIADFGTVPVANFDPLTREPCLLLTVIQGLELTIAGHKIVKALTDLLRFNTVLMECSVNV